MSCLTWIHPLRNWHIFYCNMLITLVGPCISVYTLLFTTRISLRRNSVLKNFLKFGNNKLPDELVLHTCFWSWILVRQQKLHHQHHMGQQCQWGWILLMWTISCKSFRRLRWTGKLCHVVLILIYYIVLYSHYHSRQSDYYSQWSSHYLYL